MWKVSNEPGGTAFEHGYSSIVQVMGKTGTAEVKKHHRDHDHKDLEKWNPNASHAWFAGWAPAEDPELVIITLIEHGGAGGSHAWPISRRILDGYFTKIRSKDATPVVTPAKLALPLNVRKANAAHTGGD
jgi:penicillin-binding protein 2